LVVIRASVGDQPVARDVKLTACDSLFLSEARGELSRSEVLLSRMLEAELQYQPGTTQVRS
jgi:hypothetical protein